MARQAGRRPQPQSDELVWMLFGGALRSSCLCWSVHGGPEG